MPEVTFPRGVRFSSRLNRTWAYSPSPGKAPVLKYLGATNPASRKAMNALITHVDEHGYHVSDTRYKHIDGPIVELKVKKPKPIRLLAYRISANGHLLLLGFDKGDGPIPSETLKKAKAMVAEFEKGGLHLD